MNMVSWDDTWRRHPLPGWWRRLLQAQFLLLLVIYSYLSLTESPGDTVPLYNDKWMHFTGYLVAGVSISLAAPHSRWWHRALFLLMYSTGIEIAQHFVPGRTFSGLDIAANIGGTLTGLLAFALFQRWCPRLARFFQ